MKTGLVALAVVALGLSTAAAQTPGGSAFTGSGSSNCVTKQLRIGESPPLATPSGNLPTARGRKSGTEMAGQIPTGSQADGSTVVVGPNGDCSIYRYEERPANPSR